MRESEAFGVFKAEKTEALKIIKSYKGPIRSWQDIKDLANQYSEEQYPHLRKRILDVNPGWLLEHKESAAEVSPRRIERLVSFALTKSFTPKDSLSLDHNEHLLERRHYMGIDIKTIFISDSFGVSTADMPPRAVQPEHYHASRDEVIFPLEPLWLTTKREQTLEGRSVLVLPGQFAWIGANTYHTLVNPTDRYCPHICLKFPETVPNIDWNRELPPDALLDFSTGEIGEAGVQFEQGGKQVLVREISPGDELPPSDFGYLIFGFKKDIAQGANRGDFGSFMTISPHTDTTSISADLLSDFDKRLLLFQRVQ